MSPLPQRHRPRRHVPVFATVLCLTALALSSCASLALQRGTERIAALIDAGDAATLTAASTVPFLLDDELVVRAGDVREFWDLALAAGYRLQPVAVQVAGPGARHRDQYADTLDVRTFLARDLPRRARLVRVTTARGTVLFLLGRVTDGVPTIHGLKGPLS